MKSQLSADQARAILNDWQNRKPGEHQLVLAADKLLARLWRQKQARRFAKRATG
jgi:hypothetical protein